MDVEILGAPGGDGWRGPKCADRGHCRGASTGSSNADCDGALCRIWMGDGGLAGARFDKAIDKGNHTRRKVGTLNNPSLSADDADTSGNELRTHLVVTGDNEKGKGMFSFGDLLGSGMASDEGKRFVNEAVKKIEKVQADVAALLALDTKPDNLDTILGGQWDKLKLALDDIFGTESDAESNPSSAVRTATPREEDILDDIADILDALSSEANFVAATHADRDARGVFATQALGVGAASDAFNRLTWSAEATLGMTGSTRYGTVVRKNSKSAKAKPTMGEYGAFSYATMQETQRTADAAAVSLTGIASYSGGTRAVSGTGKAYSGMMDLQVRFKANSVSGVVSGLEDKDGLPWQHNFADVDQIVLDDATLLRNATWDDSGNDATVFYTADSGLLRPVDGLANTFAGILLGQGADAGSEANGTWSVGESGAGYLAGAFGVMHVADTARPVPSGDDGSVASATLFSMATDANASTNMTEASIADGMLTVKQRSYGWTRSGDNVTYGALGSSGDETLITAKFDLAAMADEGAGAETTFNGPKWVDQVVATLTKERDLLSTLQGLKSDDTQTAERSAWQKVQDAVQYQIFGGSRDLDGADGTTYTNRPQLPIKLAKEYDSGDPATTYTTALESEVEAIDLINRVLDALSSNANLKTALDPDGTGIFDHFNSGVPDNVATTVREDQWNFVNAAKTKVNGRAFGEMRSEQTHKVTATLGTTSFTRFGAWRRESTQSSIQHPNGLIESHGGPGTFAYSPLDPTNAGTETNPAFPKGGSASYTGETVAFQNTTTLTGTVRVEVNWEGITGIGDDGDERRTLAANDFDASDGDAVGVGQMTLTISGLVSAVGDPLTYAQSEGKGEQISDIVLGGFNILVGGNGDNQGDLIVATVTSTGAPAVYSYVAETAAANSRLRYSAVGVSDKTSLDTAKAKALGLDEAGPEGAPRGQILVEERKQILHAAAPGQGTATMRRASRSHIAYICVVSG